MLASKAGMLPAVKLLLKAAASQKSEGMTTRCTEGCE